MSVTRSSSKYVLVVSKCTVQKNRRDESVRYCTRETITRHVSDRNYDFSLRLARIMHSRSLTAKQVLRSNVDTSSNASEDKRRPVSNRVTNSRPVISSEVASFEKLNAPRGDPALCF